ncbi:hypothetical protein V6B16_03710 [Salinimicrobium catena]|uniref:hypothetical protein n=1 Tax=Salinimicrobium catena TaxID=390640 RepID=UPI002FE47F39
MNKFAQIKPIAKYAKVSYFSIVLEENDPKSLFEEFVEKHTQTEKKKLNHILEWIKQIGDKYGAQLYHFRPEAEFADASALPPKGKNREPAYIEKGKKTNNMLRLYTFRVNESVVFLFNGAVKTTQYAQDCPNVGSYFHQANQLTAALQKALEEKVIRWNKDFTQIDYDSDFEIQY